MTIDYLAAIESETDRLITVASSAADSRVPACPDWTGTNLIWHIAYVQAHWAWITEVGPHVPDWAEQPQLDETRDAAYVARESNAWLLRAYRAAGEEGESYLWWDDAVGPNPDSWRRQAQEAFMHRIDAEQCAGLDSVIDGEFAADSVAEFVDNMLGTELPAGWPESEDLLCLHLTDVGERLYVHASGTRLRRELDPQGPITSTVSGAAADLSLALWRRAGWQDLDFDGDLDLIETFFTSADLS